MGYNNGTGCVKVYQANVIQDPKGAIWKNPQKVGALFIIEFVDIDYNINISFEQLQEFGWTDKQLKELLDKIEMKRMAK